MTEEHAILWNVAIKFIGTCSLRDKSVPVLSIHVYVAAIKSRLERDYFQDVSRG